MMKQKEKRRRRKEKMKRRREKQRTDEGARRRRELTHEDGVGPASVGVRGGDGEVVGGEDADGRAAPRDDARRHQRVQHVHVAARDHAAAHDLQPADALLQGTRRVRRA